MLHTIILALAFPSPLFANPTDGQVKAGSAVITHTGKKTDIHQSSARAVIDWRSFDIAPDEHTQFHQPDTRSVTLNRVTDGNPSAIAGKLSANGQIILINPNGVFFQGSSRVDVSGLIASTADIDNQDFMEGRMSFTRPGDPDAAIINDGRITAHNAGLVGLVAPNVINNGVIQADMGRIHLASGDMATVDLYGDGLMEIAVSDKVTSQIAANNGILAAKGGKIAMTAAAGRDVVNSLISVRGELRAPAVAEKNGEIFIYAAGSNKTAKTGSSAVTAQAYLDVSGMDAGERGGKISISGDHVALLDGTVMDASGWSGRTGTTDGLAASAKRDGSAGGEILIGGDYLGQGSLATAKTLHVGAATIFFNDAVKEGDAGRTIFWSDGDTYFAGNVFARGGALGGNGGFLETSGHETLQASGFADLTAVNGKKGTYFLDPANIAIYGNVNPDFTSTDGGIDLASILEFWIDPSDASTVTLTFSSDNMGSATASGGIGTNTITTSANVASSLGVGAKIRLGGADGVTALASDTSDANTYTIAAISGTTITTVESLTATYGAGTAFYRGLIGALDDKSTNDNDATRAGVAGMPLWLANAQNGLGVINFNALGIRFLQMPRSSIANSFDFWMIGQTSITHQIDAQSTTGTLGIAGQNYLLGPLQNAANGGAGVSMGTNGISIYEHGAAYMPSVNTYNAAIGSGYQIIGVNYVAKRSKIFLNNTDVHTGVTSTKPSVLMDFALGPANYGNTVGNLGEVFGYNANVSADARDLLDQYMSAKWGTALNPLPGAGTEAAEAMDAANGYSVFTTDYLVRLSQTADISLQATTNITLDLDGDVMALASGRSITLTAGNDIITKSGGEIVTSGTGSIIFDAGSNINIAHGLDLTASGTGEVTLRAGHGITSSGGGDITAQGGDITLRSDNDGNGAGAISLSAGNVLAAIAGGIGINSHGAGSVSLDGVGITAADSVTVETAGALTLGNISAGSVIAETGTGANLAIAAGRTISASDAGTAVTLAAGGNFINNAGAGAISASNGRFLVWSQDPALDTRGGLAHAFRQYDADYGATGVLGSGSGFLYALAPTLTISLAGTVSKTYDKTLAAALTAANYQVTGAVGGDTLTLAGLPAAGTYDNVNTGTGKTVGVTGIAPTGFSDGAVSVYCYQYNTSANAAIGTILARGINVTAHDFVKDYGAPDPAFTYDYSGVLGGDSVSFTGNLARASGEAGGDYAIGQGTLAVAAGNYTIGSFTSGILTIDRIAIPDTVLVVSQSPQIITSSTASKENEDTSPYLHGIVEYRHWEKLTAGLLEIHPLLAARLGIEDTSVY